MIGSGVSGLSCAVRLLQNDFDVAIVTSELPVQTTSAAAGAMWWGYGTGRLRTWADVSLGQFQHIATIDGSGVRIVRLRDVYPQPVPEPWFKNRLSFCERLTAADLPAGYVHGFRMAIPIVEPPVLPENLELPRFSGSSANRARLLWLSLGRGVWRFNRVPTWPKTKPIGRSKRRFVYCSWPKTQGTEYKFARQKNFPANSVARSSGPFEIDKSMIHVC